MDWEAPVDAWYVFLGVSIVSVAIAGVVLGLPSGPPPDANQAANTLETVAGSPTETSATWAYDADTVVIDGPTVELTNEHGTTHASIAYGVVVPVDDERLENIARGAAFEDEYDTELADGDSHAVATFLEDVDSAYDSTSATTLTASDELAVRQIAVDPDSDELDPLVETVALETTATEYGIDPITVTGIATVSASYDGLRSNSLTLDVDGEYVGPGDTAISDASTTRVFHVGSGHLEVDLESSYLNRPGDPPVDATVEFADGTTCENELGTDSTATCTNTVPRSATFDPDAPYVDYNSETGAYHVTLVAV